MQRFESVYGERATLELSWTLSPSGFSAKTQQCRWLDSEPASSVPELVQAHRHLQQRWADALATQMQGETRPGRLKQSHALRWLTVKVNLFLSRVNLNTDLG